MATTHSWSALRAPRFGPGPARRGAPALAGWRSRHMLAPRYRIPLDVAAAVALTCLSALAGMAAEPDASAADIVAAQIRAQGFACTPPVAAVRDQAQSRPNVTVWVLNCGNARYQVRLVPDMAAQITQLK